jgi:hypothetical protein
MTHADKMREATRIHTAASEIRGRILNAAAVVDLLISKLLAGYFSQYESKYSLLLSDVFTAHYMGLRTKSNLLKKIVKMEFQDYLKHYPNAFEDLDELMNFRNKLAHATIDVTESALNNGPDIKVGFVFFQDGERRVTKISPQMATHHEVKAKMLYEDLSALESILQLGFRANTVRCHLKKWITEGLRDNRSYSWYYTPVALVGVPGFVITAR